MARSLENRRDSGGCQVGEAVKLGGRDAGVDEDAVGAVARAPAPRPPRAARAGGRPGCRGSAARPRSGSRRRRASIRSRSSSSPSPASAETMHRVRVGEFDLVALVVVQQVGLVEDQEARLLPRPDLLQHLVDRVHVDHPPLFGLGGVDDVDDQVGQRRLLERRLERLDQLVGQLLDEADRVGQQVVAAGELEVPRGRVERLEEAVGDADLGPGQGVQQGRLAGVGVAGEGDLRDARSARARRASRRGSFRSGAGAGAGPRSGRGRAGGRSRSGSRPGPWCRSRRRGARGGSRAPACGPCCIRAGPARPAACPRPSGRGRRRCRGSPRCGRSPGRRAPSRGCAPGAAAARRRRRPGWRRRRRSAAFSSSSRPRPK